LPSGIGAVLPVGPGIGARWRFDNAASRHVRLGSSACGGFPRLAGRATAPTMHYRGCSGRGRSRCFVDASVAAVSGGFPAATLSVALAAVPGTQTGLRLPRGRSAAVGETPAEKPPIASDHGCVCEPERGAIAGRRSRNNGSTTLSRSGPLRLLCRGARVVGCIIDDAWSPDVLSVICRRRFSSRLVAAGRDASVLLSNLSVVVAVRPLLVEGSSLCAPVVAALVSRAIGPARCPGTALRGGGSATGLARRGSGWMLLSTSAAKLSPACDGSRPTGLAGRWNRTRSLKHLT